VVGRKFVGWSSPPLEKGGWIECKRKVVIKGTHIKRDLTGLNIYKK